MTKSEIQLSIVATCFFLAWCIMSYICYDYSHQVAKLETKKEELQSKLNIKSVELDVAKSDLREANEWMGVVFLEGANMTNKYNELKKQCKRIGK